MNKNKLKLNYSFNHYTFTYVDFTQNAFINYIMENFIINKTHTLFVRFGFEGNSVFYMSGEQIGLVVGENHDINYYNHLYNLIIFRMEDIISKYDTNSLPETIILSHKPLINLDSKLKLGSVYKLYNRSVLNTIKELDLNKSIINKKELYKIFGSKYLPLNINNENFGFLVQGDLKSKYINQLINLQTNKKMGVQNLIPEILSNKDLIKSSKVFHKKFNSGLKKITLDLIIIDCSIENYIKELNSIKYNEIIGYNSFNNNGFIRFVFDLNTGICICEALDFKIDSNSNQQDKDQDIFVRNINNYSLTIDSNSAKVLDITRTIKLDYIKSPQFISSPISNPNIGVLDVETFINSKGLGQVYCIGYGTLEDVENQSIKTYYLSDLGSSLNSDLLIITCINSMLQSKYNNYYWYIHNMGKFDIIFIYKTLEEFNLHSNEEVYKLKTTYKDGKMLKLIVSRKLNNKVIKINFLDSYNILASSLENLTKDYNVTNIKGVFPYKFVNENTLNYIGKLPDRKYFNNISTFEYEKLELSDKWSLKEESLKYLKNDILGLLEVLDKFKRILYIEHNVDLTEGLTISRLALNKYLKSYLNDNKIPLINKLNIYNFIYMGYYGGRTEVFKPYGTNLFYYDINSLYPKVALNNMPGLNCYYKKSNTKDGLNLDNLFGVFKAKVKTNNNYLGLLPVKTNSGLIFPNGEYEGVWPTPELKFAKEMGYSIKIIEGYGFDEVPSYFTNYILELYELKSKESGSIKLVNKSLLNNLLGRFGLNIIKPITKIFNIKKIDNLISTRKVNSIKEITKDTFLVNFNPLIDFDICNSHGVDYIKALNNNNNNTNIEKNIDLFQDVSVIVAAIVTSYARVYMLKFMIDILNTGGNIYYMDTDSIVTDKPLDTSLIGKELGKFKLKNEIKEAYFISNKTYCLVLNNGDIIIKCKGILNNSLSLDDFKDMYYKNKNVYGLKKSSITNLSKGSVIIEDIKTTLHHNSYTKREKLFNEKGLWTNTKPLLYNNIEKSIISINNQN